MSSRPDQHKVSIILATFNRARLLPQCIQSVLHQTFTDWELIVVDDGSEDNTFNVMDPFLKKYPLIHYLKISHHKQALAKNTGLQTALGTYITFIDSDDVYKKNHLESRLEILNKNPHLDLIQGGFEAPKNMETVDFFDHSKMISIKECVLGATFFGKKEVFTTLGGFKDLPYGEDVEFWGRAEKRFKTLKIQEPETYLYTRVEDSVSNTFERETHKT